MDFHAHLHSLQLNYGTLQPASKTSQIIRNAMPVSIVMFVSYDDNLLVFIYLFYLRLRVTTRFSWHVS